MKTGFPTEYPFFESIALRGGVPQLLSLHQARVERTLRDHMLPFIQLPDLEELCPDDCREGLTKCRVVYREKIEQISFIPYQQKIIKSLSLVPLKPSHTYFYKSTNRAFLELLLAHAGADEVIFFDHNGFITDSSYTNLLFLQGNTYYTPSTPLLEGVQRTHLLASKKIEERQIKLEDLSLYSHVGFINAMMPLEEMPLLPIESIEPLRSYLVKER